MTSRPRLKPHRRPLRRPDGSVQLGLDPHAILIQGLTSAELALLESLDGSADEAVLVARAVDAGLPPERLRHVLAMLRQHGAVVDRYADRWEFATLPQAARAALAPDARALSTAYGRSDDGYAVLSRRARRSVVVDGCGTFPGALVALLKAAAVGEVRSGRYALDLAETALQGAGGATGADPAPAVVVLPGVAAVDAARGLPWRRSGVPHLPVVLDPAVACIGPMVLPGRSSCLHCMDLTRTDLDPSWPALLAQTCAEGIGGAGRVDGETALVALAAAVSAMVVLAHLDGAGPPTGISLEAALPWPATVQRRWPMHPACDCGDPPRN